MARRARRAGCGICLVLVAAAAGAVPTLAAARRQPSCDGKRATIVGSARGETLVGTRRADVIVALGGDDVVRARGADDVVCGGGGKDELFGDSGDDRLLGQAGPATLHGGDGNDVMIRGDKAIGARMDGGAGDDEFVGSPEGGADTVTFEASAQPVTVDLSAGTATGEGSDTLTAIDTVVGTLYADHLSGSANWNEELWGLDGNDVVDGGDGNFDRVYGGLGDDVLSGGTGDGDVVVFTYAYTTPDKTGETVDLRTGSASGTWGRDLLSGFESISGTEFDDILFGTDGPNVIVGQPGQDKVYGLGGDDRLYGSSGLDEVDAGDGYDECWEFETRSNCEVSDATSGKPVTLIPARSVP